jgi:hypothetical protein
MTRDDAERLSVAFLQIVARLNETAAFVRDRDDEASWHRYRRSVGSAMAGIFDLEEQLWERFPDLRPEQLGGTYKVDPLIYHPPFYEWHDGGEEQDA